MCLSLCSSLCLSQQPIYNGPILPEGQSAWALAHSLSGEHVPIMQETIVSGFLCMHRATWNEVGLYLCWRSGDGEVLKGSVLCLCCVCLCVLVCVDV